MALIANVRDNYRISSAGNSMLVRLVDNEAKGVLPEAAENVQVLKGKGLTGTFNDAPFWLGSHRYVVERGQSTEETTRKAEALEHDGKTVIVIGNAKHAGIKHVIMRRRAK